MFIVSKALFLIVNVLGLAFVGVLAFLGIGVLSNHFFFSIRQAKPLDAVCYLVYVGLFGLGAYCFFSACIQFISMVA